MTGLNRAKWHLSEFWFKVAGYEEVTLDWPSSSREYPHTRVIHSSDPNDVFRPWIEKHVGKQGWDWQWYLTDNFRLKIRVRKSKSKYLSLMLLQWT